VVRPAGAGDAIAMGPNRALFKAEVGDAGGRFSLAETTLAPGFPGPVPHRHERFVDSFYVLDGTLRVRLSGDALDLPQGSFAFVPPGTAHTFSNPGDSPVRVLNLMAPGGFEQYLKEAAAATPAGAPPDPAVLAEIASRYDFVPPTRQDWVAAPPNTAPMNLLALAMAVLVVVATLLAFTAG
jgi:mannose-6-phosphate isomerase-like protein (cupin superfamily)